MHQRLQTQPSPTPVGSDVVFGRVDPNPSNNLCCGKRQPSTPRLETITMLQTPTQDVGPHHNFDHQQHRGRHGSRNLATCGLEVDHALRPAVGTLGRLVLDVIMIITSLIFLPVLQEPWQRPSWLETVRCHCLSRFRRFEERREARCTAAPAPCPAAATCKS